MDVWWMARDEWESPVYSKKMWWLRKTGLICKNFFLYVSPNTFYAGNSKIIMSDTSDIFSYP